MFMPNQLLTPDVDNLSPLSVCLHKKAEQHSVTPSEAPWVTLEADQSAQQHYGHTHR